MAGEAAIGIDIGGTSTKVAVVSAGARLGSVETFPTEGPPDRFLGALTDRLAALGAGDVGISVAGFVDDARSAMVYNPNIEWLQDIPLRDEIAARSGRAVRAFDADSNAAAFAESSAGAGRGAARFLCLSIGTGVGGGMVVDGRIARVAWGGLGDIGHVIVDPAGPRCPAGCRGCLEAMISAPAMEARWPGPGRPSAREIVAQARSGDAQACELLADTGRLLGIALASYAALFFPDMIAVAGGISEAGDLLLEPARHALESLTGPFYRRGLAVVKAEWGWQAPLLGAGLMALAAER